MGKVSIETGRLIRRYRKLKGMTLSQLAAGIHKSISSVSKYETGEISVDIETLSEIAVFLDVDVSRLLYHEKNFEPAYFNENLPAFFKGLSIFYGYIYDGRNNSLIRCVFEVMQSGEDDMHNIRMYMNFNDFEQYQKCENTYHGYIEHHDALTNILLTNKDSSIERASLQVLASYLDSDTKWGLFNGFSTRPMMPIATKMLLSKKILAENDALISSLKVSKDDMRLMKIYNMFSVT